MPQEGVRAAILGPVEIERDGRRGGVGGERLPVLREALGEWGGPALADLAGYRFAATEASRLAGLRLDAVADRVEAELALGPADHLVGELEALVAEHPLR